MVLRPAIDIIAKEEQIDVVASAFRPGSCFLLTVKSHSPEARVEAAIHAASRSSTRTYLGCIHNSAIDILDSFPC